MQKSKKSDHQIAQRESESRFVGPFKFENLESVTPDEKINTALGQHNAKDSTDLKKLNEIEEILAPVAQQAIVEAGTVEILAPVRQQAVIEANQVDILPPTALQAVVEAPKMEILAPITQKAVVEEIDIDISSSIAHLTVDEVSQSLEKPTPETIALQPKRKLRKSATKVKPKSKSHSSYNISEIMMHCIFFLSLLYLFFFNISVSVPFPFLIIAALTYCLHVQKRYKNQNSLRKRTIELHRQRMLVEQKRLELMELMLAERTSGGTSTF